MDIRIITPADAEWPAGLSRLVDAPKQLWAIGQPIPTGSSLAVVGARAATSYGEHVTQEIVSDLPQDVTIVSGAAYGIDGAAHRAALASGKHTVAYLAGGVDRPYPAGHRQLIERIAEHGTILSEQQPGDSPTRYRFLQRNRLIAAHSNALLVVEAGMRSGSLNAAGHMFAIGRPIGAVPGPITSAASTGTNDLLRRGAEPIVSADDALRMMHRGVIR